jgi:methylmalonyl-CoA mutase
MLRGSSLPRQFRIEGNWKAEFNTVAGFNLWKEQRVAEKPFRILTAVAAYDGHDASILALNRVLLAGSKPVEVIYLGFNMSSGKIVQAALQEGVDAVAVSSYNGGHLQFFPHLVRLLASNTRSKVLVFGGGGGTITPRDIGILEAEGVEKIYGPDWPLDAVAEDMFHRIESLPARAPKLTDSSPWRNGGPSPDDLAEALTAAENSGKRFDKAFDEWPAGAAQAPGRVIAFCGDGGGGKSTLIDELVQRFLETFPRKKIAIVANDPTIETSRAVTALLADRVRMNHIYDERVWLRSVATRNAFAPLSPALPRLLRIFRLAGYDLVIVETPGTGQTGLDPAGLDPDILVCVKTCEYGDTLQLRKDQMLRRADAVVMNKGDLEGAAAAFDQLGDLLSEEGKEGSLFVTVAKSARDPGLNRLFASICRKLGWPVPQPVENSGAFGNDSPAVLVPHARRAYLAEITDSVRAYDAWTAAQLQQAREDPGNISALDPVCARLLQEWPDRWRALSIPAKDPAKHSPLCTTPNGLKLPRIALPDPNDAVESLRFLLEEGLAGQFPFVTGIYPYRLESAQETVRQFAGLRGPEETNRRLHLLSRGVAKPRLSIAFDGVTLYGADSDDDPGSIGKIGEGGVSIDTWEDMKLVLSGFRIPDISTSMTINGPAPVILAMYLVAALEIELEHASREKGRPLDEKEREAVRTHLLQQLRGTVQADILKEVQAQNESIFQPDFAIKLLGDVQEWFISKGVKKFYSMSISGYHIGEAGATPVQELAFTLSNAFTYVENFRARGMAVDDFAPSLSFFFRVSHEAEWLAYGAVCRKIWAIALRDVYGAGERSQRLKFHTQTSGRALQSAEWDTLNPVRLTYHALMGLLANTNSLHVDSADEPMTTPGEKWVRQASLIPRYLREEAEAFVIQNLLSGSYAFRALMKEVQAQVLEEFDRIDRLGGVGPATERGYQRRCIARNSSRYEHQRRGATPKHPEAPVRKIVGYNTYVLPKDHGDAGSNATEIVRSNADDWNRQLARVRQFKERHAQDAPVYLDRLKQAASGGKNVFEELLETVRHATLGQMIRTLADVGGRFRKMV